MRRQNDKPCIASKEEKTWHVCSVISGTDANVRNVARPGTMSTNGMGANVWLVAKQEMKAILLNRLTRLTVCKHAVLVERNRQNIQWKV